MTNYEKYTGTLERFAELIIQMGCESGVGEELTRHFCRGGCSGEDKDAVCTDENLRKCIITWLRKDAEEAKHHLELLACYGCRYKEDCEEPFEHGRPMCDERHVDAVEFAKRLNNESKRLVFKRSRKYTIYAVDFDGTLCESVWPGIGSPNIALIEHLKKRRKQGNKVILWTCRCGKRLKEAVDFCRQYGLEFDEVNRNLPEMIKYYKNDCRKVAADVYIDDKAINKTKYKVPFRGDNNG